MNDFRLSLRRWMDGHRAVPVREQVTTLGRGEVLEAMGLIRRAKSLLVGIPPDGTGTRLSKARDNLDKVHALLNEVTAKAKT